MELLEHLWNALNFRISEVLRFDFVIGLAAGAGATVVAVRHPNDVLQTIAPASGLVGVIIGAVIAGVAVQAAFMDQKFLLKLRAINRSPVRYLSPFLFTAVIGVFAMIGLITLSAMTARSPVAVLGTLAGLTGFLAMWSVASLLYCLSTLVQFMDLKVDALPTDEVDDREA